MLMGMYINTFVCACAVLSYVVREKLKKRHRISVRHDYSGCRTPGRGNSKHKDREVGTGSASPGTGNSFRAGRRERNVREAARTHEALKTAARILDFILSEMRNH